MDTPKRSETGLRPCVFPLLRLFFGYVCTCGCFFCDFVTCIWADDTCPQLCAFWCVFMPFGCFFPLLCVFLGYVCTCGCFFLRFSDVYLQMTCALNFAPFGLFSCLLDVFSLCCVCFWICVRVWLFFSAIL